MKNSDKMSAEEKKDWEEKMSEPLKPIKKKKFVMSFLNVWKELKKAK